MSALVYKICGAADWANAKKSGRYDGAPVDVRDGFIHLSGAEQVRETAERHFRGKPDLVLVALPVAALGPALRWEPARGGALFPHLYGPLDTALAAWVKPLPVDAAGRHVLPGSSALSARTPQAGGDRPASDRRRRPPRPPLSVRLMHRLNPERAHRVAIYGLKLRPARPAPAPDPQLGFDLIDRVFPNPIGLAAGFDKNAEVPDALLGLGFGFVEVGTVTPQPQPGNPRPRLFRLPADRAIINRLGFNSAGHDVAAANLERRRGRSGVIGVNIGANRDSADRVADYVAGVERFAPLAAYLTVNISSPNTEGLRDLQEADGLTALIGRVTDARDTAAERLGRPVPLFVKIAPDLNDSALVRIVDVIRGAGLDGLVIANTTVSRDGLKSRRRARQAGGLSGPPLFERSTAMLARARQLAGDDLILIGVGGIDSARAAWRKFTAGADLVQVYTGMIYEGPGFAHAIAAGLREELAKRNFAHIRDARGIETARWAAAWPRST